MRIRKQRSQAAVVQRQSSASDRILDAAEAVVIQRGMGHLTLAAAAEQAGLSKAGVLHHFPGMDELIRAMVARHVVAWRDEFRRAYRVRADAGEACPAVGVLMSHCLSGAEAWTDAERARNRVMVAALVHDERHVEPLRQVHREMDTLLAKDRLPPGIGEAIHLAVNGLWFQWIFGMGEVSAHRLASIRATISRLAGVSPLERSSSGTRSRLILQGVRGAKPRGVQLLKQKPTLTGAPGVKSTRTKSHSRGDP